MAEEEGVAVGVSEGRKTFRKLFMAVVVINKEKTSPLLLQGNTALPMSIYGVSGAIKMDILQINAHINNIPTPQVQITPKNFLLYKTLFFKPQLDITWFLLHFHNY